MDAKKRMRKIMMPSSQGLLDGKRKKKNNNDTIPWPQRRLNGSDEAKTWKEERKKEKFSRQEDVNNIHVYNKENKKTYEKYIKNK